MGKKIRCDQCGKRVNANRDAIESRSEGCSRRKNCTLLGQFSVEQLSLLDTNKHKNNVIQLPVRLKTEPKPVVEEIPEDELYEYPDPIGYLITKKGRRMELDG